MTDAALQQNRAQAITVQRESRAMTAADIREQVNLVQQVMKAVMQKDTHYGVIPGTKKPSLYKPGAEVLAATFRIAVSYRVEDLSSDGEIRYRVTAVGTHQTSGIVMGEGVGECSSGEEKFKWRSAICDEEFDETPENRKRVKFSKYNNRVEKKKQVRTEPADQANTILKMAAKRAQVAMTLNVTAASDIFTQDIEDLPEELRGEAYDDVGSTMDPATKADYEAAIDALVDRPSAENLFRQIAAACKAIKDKAAYDDLKARLSKKAESFT